MEWRGELGQATAALDGQRVVAQQVRFALWHAEEGRSLPAGKNCPVRHIFFLQADVWRT